jgi:hypothetical protein
MCWSRTDALQFLNKNFHFYIQCLTLLGADELYVARLPRGVDIWSFMAALGWAVLNIFIHTQIACEQVRVIGL